jgi:hypothetical protein
MPLVVDKRRTLYRTSDYATVAVLTRLFKPMADRLNAVDVLNLDYLRTIARAHDLAYTTDPHAAFQMFAYDLIEAADVGDQNEILAQLLIRMTLGHSKETNREVLKYLAQKCHTDIRLIMEFAKQEGILV